MSEGEAKLNLWSSLHKDYMDFAIHCDNVSVFVDDNEKRISAAQWVIYKTTVAFNKAIKEATR